MSRTLVALGVLLVVGRAEAQMTVDGVVEAGYGQALATDPMGDNADAAMDLRQLFVTNDATSLYLAFTVRGDLGVDKWGKYVVYLDTTNDTMGATKDPWQRSVAVSDPHKPEYMIATWVDQPPYGAARTELWRWNAGTWTKQGQVAEAALTSAAGGSIIEWRIPLADLGSPTALWLEAWSTGNGTKDNARDTINSPPDDWNGKAGDWASLATLKCSTLYAVKAGGDGGAADGATVDAGVADAGRDGAGGRDGRVADGGVKLDGSTATDGAMKPDGPAAGDAGGDAGKPSDAAPTVDGGGLPRKKEGCGCATAEAPEVSLLALAALALLGWRRARAQRSRTRVTPSPPS
ncbi:MAG: hypothetical protein IT371_01085 [Deltaproteobacteria bacterium]|nr:hypothetical protein [Deltaproteobacteria bacterium]